MESDTELNLLSEEAPSEGEFEEETGAEECSFGFTMLSLASDSAESFDNKLIELDGALVALLNLPLTSESSFRVMPVSVLLFRTAPESLTSFRDMLPVACPLSMLPVQAFAEFK